MNTTCQQPTGAKMIKSVIRTLLICHDRLPRRHHSFVLIGHWLDLPLIYFIYKMGKRSEAKRERK